MPSPCNLLPMPIGDMDDNDTIVSQSSSIEVTNYQKKDAVQIARTEMTGNAAVDSILKTLDQAKDVHEAKSNLERFYDDIEKLITDDNCTLILLHISRILQCERYASCHAKCIELLSYIGIYLPIPTESQPECGYASEAFNIIKQYIFHQPRTPHFPALDVMNIILRIPEEALNCGYAQLLLTDDFYTLSCAARVFAGRGEALPPISSSPL